MRTYWNVYKQFVRSTFVRETEFRANFFAQIAQSFVWVLFFVVVIAVIFRNLDSIAGWQKNEAVLLIGCCVFVSAVRDVFFWSIMELPNHVRMGTLDYILLKPIDAQFYLSSRKMSFAKLGTLLAGIILIVYGVINSPHPIATLNWIPFFLMLASGVVSFYVLSFFFMVLSIWLVKVDNLWVLGELTLEVARYPVDMFGAIARRVFLYVIPCGIIGYIPASTLLRGPNFGLISGSLLWASLGFFGVRALWRYGCRNYSSASS